MRHTLAGIAIAFLALLFICPAHSSGQIRGEVESLGFGGNYRPDCWTPMVVRLRTAGLKTQFYQLQVVQEDLDRDRPVYTRQISVDTSQPEQKFWMFFIPTPQGLPNRNENASRDQLRQKLRVEIAPAPSNPSGLGRPVGQFSLVDVPNSLDGPNRANDQNVRPRGQRLVVAVHDGTSTPSFAEYGTSVGTSEDLVVVMVQPRDLPENAIAYDAVDAILWLNVRRPPARRGRRPQASRDRTVRAARRPAGRLPADRARPTRASRAVAAGRIRRPGEPRHLSCGDEGFARPSTATHDCPVDSRQRRVGDGRRAVPYGDGHAEAERDRRGRRD
jgi:hypothetical protein